MRSSRVHAAVALAALLAAFTAGTAAAPPPPPRPAHPPHHPGRHGHGRNTGHQENHRFRPTPVADIMVGTAGTVIQSSSFLYTFDPFDKPLRSETFERMPYIASVVDGQTRFYTNHLMPGCSSTNPVNANFTTNVTARSHLIRCRQGRNYVGLIMACRLPLNLTVSTLPSLRLSTLIRQRQIRSIPHLKIDAQGSDFALLRDVFENSVDREGVEVISVQAECQWLARTPALYDSPLPNDCEAIQTYLQNRSYRTGFANTNCQIAENDIIASRDEHIRLAKFQEVRYQLDPRLVDSVVDGGNEDWRAAGGEVDDGEAPSLPPGHRHSWL